MTKGEVCVAIVNDIESTISDVVDYKSLSMFRIR